VEIRTLRALIMLRTAMCNFDGNFYLMLMGTPGNQQNWSLVLAERFYGN
jgi:hypothetical protein